MGIKKTKINNDDITMLKNFIKKIPSNKTKLIEKLNLSLKKQEFV